MADWECDRAIHQALEYQKTGVSTAGHPDAGWDTCFRHCFAALLQRWADIQGGEL
jgi:hypothetical protein